jgi:hypothetical protein
MCSLIIDKYINLNHFELFPVFKKLLLLLFQNVANFKLLSL